MRCHKNLQGYGKFRIGGHLDFVHHFDFFVLIFFKFSFLMIWTTIPKYIIGLTLNLRGIGKILKKWWNLLQIRGPSYIEAKKLLTKYLQGYQLFDFPWFLHHNFFDNSLHVIATNFFFFKLLSTPSFCNKNSLSYQRNYDGEMENRRVGSPVVFCGSLFDLHKK
jgi:hypothetical protein